MGRFRIEWKGEKQMRGRERGIEKGFFFFFEEVK